MPGYANIFVIGEEQDRYGKKFHRYQFNYIVGGSSFARIFDEEKLRQFLASELGLAEDEVERVMRELHEKGRTVVGELDIPEHETSMLGLEQGPTDF